MSATNRGGQRQVDDFYATPAWATRAILPPAQPIDTTELDNALRILAALRGGA